jgi:hypothetical protein
MKTATPLRLHYSIACMDKHKSWLSSNRTTGLSFDGLEYAVKCFTYLRECSRSFYPDGWTVC